MFFDVRSHERAAELIGATINEAVIVHNKCGLRSKVVITFRKGADFSGEGMNISEGVIPVIAILHKIAFGSDRGGHLQATIELRDGQNANKVWYRSKLLVIYSPFILDIAPLECEESICKRLPRFCQILL